MANIKLEEILINDIKKVLIEKHFATSEVSIKIENMIIKEEKHMMLHIKGKNLYIVSPYSLLEDISKVVGCKEINELDRYYYINGNGRAYTDNCVIILDCWKFEEQDYVRT